MYWCVGKISDEKFLFFSVLANMRIDGIGLFIVSKVWSRLSCI